MKTVGIIAEYNPLHNGHKYQIDQARALTGADFVIIVMSGDFVQRGEPAVYDKYTRTCMALNAGADLVLELPSCFAAASAEDFAACGVALLDRLGIVDFLCFGSECGKIEPLLTAARILVDEPKDYKEQFKQKLTNGMTFPKAREESLTEYLADSSSANSYVDWNLLLSSPNNILGIEYCKALLRQNSSIQPITIRRNGSGYHDLGISDPDQFASASAIRHALSKGDMNSAQTQLPAFFDIHNLNPIFPDDLSDLLNYRILDLLHSGIEYTRYLDVSKELADRLEHQTLDFHSFTSRIQALKTRQYTYTRISRALLHIILGVCNDDMKMFRANGYAGYARILGFKKSARPLLSAIKSSCEIPLISKVANASKTLKEQPVFWKLFQYDLHASHVYQMIQYQKYGIKEKNEFTHSVIILEP